MMKQQIMRICKYFSFTVHNYKSNRSDMGWQCISFLIHKEGMFPLEYANEFVFGKLGEKERLLDELKEYLIYKTKNG